MAAIVFAFALSGMGQDPAPTTLPDVEVSALPRTTEVARRYVDRIADAPLHAISLATWRTPLCIETENLRPETVLVVTSQIAARAAGLGVETRTRDCRPNILLVGTSDGRFTAAELVAAYPRAFKASSGETQGDAQALQRFAEQDAPVRWWTISAQYDTDTRSFAEALWDSNSFGAPTRDTTGRVFFNETLVRAMVQTIVIIDATRTGAVPAEALADYVAMVVLAEIKPDADMQTWPTVMNLWRDGAGVSGMTAWDRRYLCALYAAPVLQPGFGAPIRSRYQLGEIARRMADDSPDSAEGCS